MNRCVIRQPRTPVFLGPVAIAQSSTMISLQSRVQWLQEIAILLACREGWRLSSLRSLDGLILPTLSNPILPAILKGHAMLCCLHCPLQAVSSDACPPSFHRKKSFNPEITTGLCYVATLQVVLIELCAGWYLATKGVELIFFFIVGFLDSLFNLISRGEGTLNTSLRVIRDQLERDHF